MKKLLFLGACLVALASQPVSAQTGGASVITIRVTETSNKVLVAVAVADANGKTELFEFDNGRKGDGLKTSAKGFQQLLSKFFQQGYRLQSTFTSTAAPADDRTTLVFVKEQ